MALDKTTEKRLTKLIEFMESLPKSANKHFDMSSWFQHDGDDDNDHGFGGDPVRVGRKHLTMCGTSACALGWAATMPYFKKAGLVVDYSIYGSDIHFKGLDVFADETRRSGLFILSSGQSVSLFGHEVPVKTPKQWAKRARKLLKEWSKA